MNEEEPYSQKLEQLLRKIRSLKIILQNININMQTRTREIAKKKLGFERNQ